MEKKTALYLCIGYLITSFLFNDIFKIGNAQLNSHTVLGLIVGTWVYHFAIVFRNNLRKAIEQIKKEDKENET